MASELSSFIEEQLRAAGVDPDKIERVMAPPASSSARGKRGKTPNGRRSSSDGRGDLEEAGHDEALPLLSTSQGTARTHHTTLMGALRVEARMQEQASSINLRDCQRNVCVGGGIAFSLVILALLLTLSRGGQLDELMPPPPAGRPTPPRASPPPPSPSSGATAELLLSSEPAGYETAVADCEAKMGSGARLASYSRSDEHQAIKQLCATVSCWRAAEEGEESAAGAGSACPNFVSFSQGQQPPDGDPPCNEPRYYVCVPPGRRP
ncbi:hypothetical protein FOA52_014282 [Chlamydomonas sp. UWO 241]|nr:hypothetical protein FOA52_014282 [Chlamydomonas sp. UWO 241]